MPQKTSDNPDRDRLRGARRMQGVSKWAAMPGIAIQSASIRRRKRPRGVDELVKQLKRGRL